MSTADVAALLEHAVGTVRDAIDNLVDWAAPTGRPGQYAVDVAANDAAVEVLESAGVAILSEETGWSGGGDVTVVVDPLDGSDNAARGVPAFGVSLCAVDDLGPLVAVVANLASGSTYQAVRGGGSRRDGIPIAVTPQTRLEGAMVVLKGHPPTSMPSKCRSLGAAAIELCGVAEGTFDGYIDWDVDHHGPWDYLAGAFICTEAGGVVADAFGRSDPLLAPLDERRTPVAAANAVLLDQLTSVLANGRHATRATA